MAKASKEEALKLALLSSDCSSLLSHLVRQNSDGTRADHQALAILKSILGLDTKNNPCTLPVLKGGLPDWFRASNIPKIYHAHARKFVAPTPVSSVCFTESTLVGLRAHRDIFSVKYGLAFEREYLFKRGANPCLNIREDLLDQAINTSDYKKLLHYIPDQLIGYINIINETYDPTYEREWRFLGDLVFSHQDIKFIFCPQKDFEIFSRAQKKGVPCLFDLEWLNKI